MISQHDLLLLLGSNHLLSVTTTGNSPSQDYTNQDDFTIQSKVCLVIHQGRQKLVEIGRTKILVPLGNFGKRFSEMAIFAYDFQFFNFESWWM